MIEENDVFDADPNDSKKDGDAAEENVGDDMVSDEDLDGAAGGARQATD